MFINKLPEERTILDVVQFKILLNNLHFYKEYFGEYLSQVIINNELFFKLLYFKENTELKDLSNKNKNKK